MNHVVDKTPVGRSFKNMCAKDRESLKVKFNSAYHLNKWERPFSDFSDLLKEQRYKTGKKVLRESLKLT